MITIIMTGYIVGVLAVMQRVNWSHNGTAPSNLPLFEYIIITIIIIAIIIVAIIVIIIIIDIIVILVSIINHFSWNTTLQFHINTLLTLVMFQNIWSS